MNLFVFPYQSDNFYTSPDTAVFRKDSSENSVKYYVPDKIETLRAIPFAYIKIDKACKCIREEYAHLYYSTCGWGIHICTYDINEGNCLDNSVFLAPITPIKGNGPYQGFEFFDTAIQRASEYMSLRSGDLIVLELEDFEAFEIEQDSTIKFCYKDLNIEIIA